MGPPSSLSAPIHNDSGGADCQASSTPSSCSSSTLQDQLSPDVKQYSMSSSSSTDISPCVFHPSFLSPPTRTPCHIKTEQQQTGDSSSPAYLTDLSSSSSSSSTDRSFISGLQVVDSSDAGRPTANHGRKRERPPTWIPPSLAKHPRKPKSPKGQFLFYYHGELQSLRQEFPQKTVIELAQIASERWKLMSPEEKQPFKEAKQKDEMRYRQELEHFLNSTEAQLLKLQAAKDELKAYYDVRSYLLKGCQPVSHPARLSPLPSYIMTNPPINPGYGVVFPTCMQFPSLPQSFGGGGGVAPSYYYNHPNSYRVSGFGNCPPLANSCSLSDPQMLRNTPLSLYNSTSSGVAMREGSNNTNSYMVNGALCVNPFYSTTSSGIRGPSTSDYGSYINNPFVLPFYSSPILDCNSIVPASSRMSEPFSTGGAGAAIVGSAHTSLQNDSSVVTDDHSMDVVSSHRAVATRSSGAGMLSSSSSSTPLLDNNQMTSMSSAMHRQLLEPYRSEVTSIIDPSMTLGTGTGNYLLYVEDRVSGHNTTPDGVSSPCAAASSAFAAPISRPFGQEQAPLQRQSESQDGGSC